MTRRHCSCEWFHLRVKKKLLLKAVPAQEEQRVPWVLQTPFSCVSTPRTNIEDKAVSLTAGQKEAVRWGAVG